MIRRFMVNNVKNGGGVIFDLSQTHSLQNGTYKPNPTRIFKLSFKDIVFGGGGSSGEHDYIRCTTLYDGVTAMGLQYTNDYIQWFIGKNVQIPKNSSYNDFSVYIEYSDSSSAIRESMFHIYRDGVETDAYEAPFYYYRFFMPLVDITIEPGKNLVSIGNIISSEVDNVGD